MIGETLAVYVRALSVNAKRLHYLMFAVNESKGAVASIFECINSFVDLNVRKMAEWPPEARALMDEMIAAHSKATWPAPVSGVMSV
jgi:acyl-CoA thioesterase FadM